ncbi:MAG TPA: TIGR01777 family oxidoreductase [Dehalococcoidia bacterium]|nr:TIGR01777 family oxidoreductase [Dehalococcoidia bacterium]
MADMKVAIAGSSGLIGVALADALTEQGHQVVRLKRGHKDEFGVDWDPPAGWMRPAALDECDAVVNLCGASIADGRWSDKRRRELLSSRVDPARTLVAAMSSESGPKRLVNASAVGFYGDRGDETLTEKSCCGSGFLSDLVVRWEAESLKGIESGLSVTCARFGVVIGKGGALKRMLLPFKFGLGGRLGSGRQWFSWVALDDVVAALEHLVINDASEVVNVTAPEPVTNREFTKALGRALRRPTLLPIPRLPMRILFGASVDETLFVSQRVVPERLQASGFEFAHPDITSGVMAAVGKNA